MSVNVEALLREALAPVDPPERLSRRLEETLASLAASAQEELEGWELTAMRDPRNWVRPVAAAAVAAGAGGALVALRVRARQRDRSHAGATIWDFAQQTIKDVAEETRRILPDR